MKRSRRSTLACALVGTAAGALLQSTSAVATLLGGTTSAGMTTLFERSVWIVRRYAELLQRSVETNVDRRLAQPMSA